MLDGVRLDHCINLRGDIYADVAGWLEMASEGCLKAVTDGGLNLLAEDIDGAGVAGSST